MRYTEGLSLCGRRVPMRCEERSDIVIREIFLLRSLRESPEAVPVIVPSVLFAYSCGVLRSSYIAIREVGIGLVSKP